MTSINRENEFIEEFSSDDENQKIKLPPIKKHKCPFCDKYFSQKTSIPRHVSAVHEGNKSFVCETCGASFSQHKNLAVHVTATHEKVKPFICELCGVSYRQALI